MYFYVEFQSKPLNRVIERLILCKLKHFFDFGFSVRNVCVVIGRLREEYVKILYADVFRADMSA